MAGLTPEVMNALVRLMSREIDYGEIDTDALYALGAAARDGRQTLHEITLELKRRGETYAQMADRWGVDAATPTRWANPPSPPGRRRESSED